MNFCNSQRPNAIGFRLVAITCNPRKDRTVSTKFSRRSNFVFSITAVLPLVSALLIINLGCSDETLVDAPANVEVASQATDKPETSVVKSTSTVEASPSRNQLPVASTGPKEICNRFLNLLRDGNRITAERLLTRKALTVTSQAQLELEAMGSEKAKYHFSDVRFATHKQKLAYVDCKIKDTVDGQSFETEMTWLVKTQKEGWRISGILVEVAADQPKNLLSFENFDDVARIKGSLAEDIQETHTVERQAEADSGKLKK